MMVNPESETQEIRQRIDMDLFSRSFAGIVIYLLLWPAIFLSFEFYSREPLASWGAGAALGALSLARFGLHFSVGTYYQRSPERWMELFALFSLSQAAIWGALFSFVVLEYAAEPVGFATAVTVAGLSAGVAASLSPKLWLSCNNIVLLLLPAALTCLVAGRVTTAVLIICSLA